MAAAYALFGALWILLSDRILEWLVPPNLVGVLQTFKGLFFIVITALLLALLVRGHVRKLVLAQRQLMAEEARYRLLAENMTDVVWALDLPTRKFTYVSPSVKALRGYTPEEVMSLPLEASLTEHSLKEVESWLEQELKQDAKGSGLVRSPLRRVEQPRKDGSIVQTEVSSVIVMDDQGMPSQLIGITRDISERHGMEEALRRNEAELSAVYEHAPVMMCLLDDQLKLVRANRALEEFLRMPAAILASPESEGAEATCSVMACLKYLADPDSCGLGARCLLCPLRASLLEVRDTGRVVQRCEARPPSSAMEYDHEPVLLFSCARITVGTQVRLLLCLEDVTVQRRLEEQFRQAQKMEAIGRLAGGVAHDFNNILAAILMNVGLLKHGRELTREVREGLDELELEAQRAARLTRQLLLFSRREVMQVRPVDLNELLGGLLKMLRRLMGEDITLEFRGTNRELWVEADPGMLEQVVVNLVVNARDAMPNGGRIALATRWVRLDAEQRALHPDAFEGPHVQLSVTDTGCGIEERLLSRIFEPFFTTKQAGKGSGLGLAMVHGIVRQHGGWVEVRSVVGQGSTFSFFLPAKRTSVPASGTVAAAAPTTGHETILLVEDETTVRQSAARLLERQGYHVVQASGGPEALSLWGSLQGEFDLVLSDMVMPGGWTGLDLLRHFRGQRSRTKAVLMSGYSVESLDQSLLDREQIAFVSKPFDSGTLLRTVRQQLDLDASQSRV